MFTRYSIYLFGLLASPLLAQSSAENLALMSMTNACKGCDLSNAQLVGVDFSKKDLEEANFTGSNADTANFTGANLDQVLLEGASFKAARFDKATVTVKETDWKPRAGGGNDPVLQKGVDFRSATFSGAKVDLSLYASNYNGANFSGASEVKINSMLCSFLDPEYDFYNRWLGKASSFKSADFSNIKGSRYAAHAICSLGGNFQNAKFDGSKFNGVLNSENVLYIVESNLQEASFVAADLQGASFHNSNLRGANFESANLSKVNFEGANLSGVNFRGANLDGANLKGAVLCETIDPKGRCILDVSNMV